ncbi:hypothetical protein EDB89DRAFT_1904093 [Lactarius sanguifluus]|nr:hypothetical protein EDB89DRAFT_1904093 [Lactarius sanguifluus]
MGSNSNTTIRVPPPTRGKHTFSNVITSTPLETQSGTAKRTRAIVDEGPSHGCPMPLNLTQESKIVDQQGFDGGAIKGKQVQRQGAPSSGHVPPTHVPSYSNTNSFHNFDVDDNNSVSEDDDDDDEQIVELSLKNPAKFAEVMATERPTWKEPGSIDMPHSVKLKSRQSTDSLGSSGSVGSAPTGATPVSTSVPLTPGPQAHLTELSDEAGTPPPNQSPTVTPSLPAPTVSHVDTDLVFVEGTTKIMLTNVTIAFALSRDALITATKTHGHGGGIVQCRLQVNNEYLTKLISLMRVRFPLFHGEVKERCNTVSVPPIIAIGSAAEITWLIQKQLFSYNYIFPGAPGNMGIARLVVQLLLCLISIIFSQRTKVKMLYATLYEWCGGAQQIAEFSANAYLDVYLANMNTLKHILNNQECAYHIMMNDIYAQASSDWCYGSTTGGVLEDHFNNNTHLRPDNLREFEITVIGNLSEEYLILWQKYR